MAPKESIERKRQKEKEKRKREEQEAQDILKSSTQPCVRATGYCRAMAQCALQNYSAQHSARYGSGSWVCNPMS